MKAFAVLLFGCLTLYEVKGQSNDVCLSLPRNSEPAEVSQGRPGKRGAPGPPGPVGECSCNVTDDVRELNEQVMLLSDQLQAAMQRIGGVTSRVDSYFSAEPGWYSLSNGYQYFFTETRQTWQESRVICQRLGGELAAAGLRNPMSRKLITNAFLGSTQTWIGLDDLKREGSWMWSDGVRSTQENVRWKSGEPNGRRNANCAHINYPSHPRYTLDDYPCQYAQNALCEKRIS